MLVIQIALGIVLAFIILGNIGIILASLIYLAAAFIGVALIVVGFIWLDDYPIALIAILALVSIIGGWRYMSQRIYESSYEAKIKKLESIIERRDLDGYDVSDQLNELRALRDAHESEQLRKAQAVKQSIVYSPSNIKRLKATRPKLSARALKNERERRRKLGYED